MNQYAKRPIHPLDSPLSQPPSHKLQPPLTHTTSGGTASVYHVTADGWKKVRGDDVLDLHARHYPKPELHPANCAEVI